MSLLASGRIGVTTVVLTVAAFLVSVSARAEKRVALVIGNAAYTELSVLQNPINDATEMETSLRQLGFQVLSLKNARKADVENAIRRFGELVHGADVAVFFYSGHGFRPAAPTNTIRSITWCRLIIASQPGLCLIRRFPSMAC